MLSVILQHIQEKARKEVIEILGDGDEVVYPTDEQCSEMKYIYMIIKEVIDAKNPVSEASKQTNQHSLYA
jgi:hypothetical protein